MKFDTSLRYLLLCTLVIFVLIQPKQIANGENVSNIISEAKAEIKYLESLEYEAIKGGKILDQCTVTPELGHQIDSCIIMSCVPSNPLAESVARRLVSSHSREEIKEVLESNNLLDGCVENRTVVCDENSKYRTIDASCNNLERPNEGRAGSCHRRLFPANYSDGIKKFRVGSDGAPLPEPRIISLNVTRFICKSATRTSNFLMNFGQFITHDTTLTPLFNFEGQQFPDCCRIEHPECIPIKIFPDDPDFKDNCLNLVRTEPCATCFYDGVKQQINNKTAAIDLDHIYGSNQTESDIIRGPDGKLKSEYIPGVGEIPPMKDIEGNCTGLKQITNPKTGDTRSSEHPLILSVHTIFLRCHNKIADELRRINPHWDPEILFQETRKVLIAVFQNIVYCAYLPKIIGHDLATQFQFCKEATDYDPILPLVSFTEVFTAFFRFGHTTIPIAFRVNSSDGESREIPLKDLYNNIIFLKNGELDDFIRGSLIQTPDEFDRCMSESVTKFLLAVNGSLGLDLASFNIQRGRDNGLPSYTFIRRQLNPNQKINSFQDLKTPMDEEGDEILKKVCINKGVEILKKVCMDEEGVDILEKVYRSVDDIDLFIGMLCEKPILDAVVGPTAGHFIGLQFHNLMFADRFFYTHEGVFSKDQLKSIRRTTMSTILCEVTNLTEVSVDVMNPKSSFVSCKKIPRLDLSLWKEEV